MKQNLRRSEANSETQCIQRTHNTRIKETKRTDQRAGPNCLRDFPKQQAEYCTEQHLQLREVALKMRVLLHKGATLCHKTMHTVTPSVTQPVLHRRKENYDIKVQTQKFLPAYTCSGCHLEAKIKSCDAK